MCHTDVINIAYFCVVNDRMLLLSCLSLLAVFINDAHNWQCRKGIITPSSSVLSQTEALDVRREAFDLYRVQVCNRSG